MKLLVIVLVTLIAVVSLALMAMENPGYILIAMGSWTVETTLALAVIVAILTFATIYYAIRFVSRLLGVPGGVRHWRQSRRERKAMLSLTRGLIDLAEGRWQSSEKQLLKYINDGHAPLLNYLAAARAAQAQGADQRRDNYLKQAHESVSGADIAVGLTQAELQLQHHQLEQALATLRHLQQLSPKHAQVLKALAELYEELGDWEHLLDLLPSLRKRKVLSTIDLDKLSQKSYLALLALVSEDGDTLSEVARIQNKSEQLHNLWHRIPKHFQENEAILLCYVKRLVECGETDQLEPLIRMALKNNRSEALVYCYGLVTSADTGRHLTMAESLLVGFEHDAVTLLTVGRLSLRNKLWGKARSYLESSISSRPSVEAYNELGNLLDKLGETEQAAECFREGLSLAPGCEHTIPIIMDATLGNAIENLEGISQESYQHALDESKPEDIVDSKKEVLS